MSCWTNGYRGPWQRTGRLCIALGLIALLVSGCVPGAPSTASSDEQPDAGTRIDPPKDLKDWTLISQTGKPLRLSSLRGRAVLLFFGYTHCPDVCPLTLAEWKKVKTALGDTAQDVTFVFISVDSKRDNPAVLAQFVGKYDPAFIGLTGDDATLRLIGQDYGLYFTPHAGSAGANATDVEHSPPSYLIGRDGRLHMIFSYGVPVATISTDIQTVLQQQ